MVDFECSSLVLLLTSLVMSDTQTSPPIDEKSKTQLSYLIREQLSIATHEIGKTLEGRLLTLIDASFSDPEQRKAFKDVSREILSACYHNPIYRMKDSLVDEIRYVVDEKERPKCCSPTEVGSCWIDEEKLDYKYSRTEK